MSERKIIKLDGIEHDLQLIKILKGPMNESYGVFVSAYILVDYDWTRSLLISRETEEPVESTSWSYPENIEDDVVRNALGDIQQIWSDIQDDGKKRARDYVVEKFNWEPGIRIWYQSDDMHAVVICGTSPDQSDYDTTEYFQQYISDKDTSWGIIYDDNKRKSIINFTSEESQ